MRILFVATSTELGGAEKTVYTLATSLNPERFQVAGVVSLKPPGPYAERLSRQSVPVDTLGLRGLPRPRHLHELLRLIDRSKPDVVHAVMYQAIQLCRLAKGRSAASFKLVSSPRVSYRTRSWLSLAVDRALKGRDDLLVSECEASRRHLIERLGYEPAKVLRIYNGVETPGAAAPPQRQRKRLELGLSQTDILVGSLGRLDAQKGHSTLLEALALLPRLPLHCVLIGEGPRRRALEAQIRRLNLGGRVRLVGASGEAAAWLSSLDLFVLPSLWEGLPNALLEAMALGLPVAASAVDGVPELVSDGRDGLLVSPGQPAALANRLAELARDAALRSRLGAAARRTVFERFSLERMLGEYESAYCGNEK